MFIYPFKDPDHILLPYINFSLAKYYSIIEKCKVHQFFHYHYEN